MNGRRIDRRELERRLREEAPREWSLSDGFRSALDSRLDVQGRIGADAAGDPHGRHGRATLSVISGRDSRKLGWLLAGSAIAAALVIAAAAVWPRARISQGPEPEARPAVAQALGDAVQASMSEPPRALALAIERSEDPLATEAQRLLADAKSLAEELAAPVWGMRAPASP